MQFSTKFGKVINWHPLPLGLALPSRKSWIRLCNMFNSVLSMRKVAFTFVDLEEGAPRLALAWLMTLCSVNDL